MCQKVEDCKEIFVGNCGGCPHSEPEGVCEACGRPCEYDPDMCICDHCTAELDIGTEGIYGGQYAKTQEEV